MYNINTQISVDPPAHSQRNEGQNVVLNWLPSDSQERFIENCKDKNKKKYFDQMGWSQPACFTYRLNSNGFRTEEISENTQSIVGLGCSHTTGVGIPEESTWIAQLGKFLQMPYYNLGSVSASLDTVFRIACYYLDIIKPHCVVLLCPNESRFEVNTSTDYNDVYIPQMNFNGDAQKETVAKSWWSNDENSKYNSIKNVCAIRHICQQRGIKIYVYNTDELKTVDLARDYLHHGPVAHANFAKKVFKHIRSGI